MATRRTSIRLPQLVLAVLLLAGQLGAIVHAFEHDPGATASQACASCLTAAQLSAAAIAHPVDLSLAPASAAAPAAEPAVFASAAVPAARQRGPPALLPTI